MKRQAAITGPTPPMIQWTLVVDCPLRDLTRTPPAAAASRQLRGLREWSRAKAEGRIRNGICLHENCDPGPEPFSDGRRNEWLGFPEAEPFAVFGGQEQVIKICGNCPANGAGNGVEVAGCWGVIPFTDAGTDTGPVCELRLRTGQRLEVIDLPGWFERLLGIDNSILEFESIFPATRPRWYGIWIGSEWNRDQVEWMSGFLALHREEIPTLEMVRMADAADAARMHRLRLCYDRVPAGRSDSFSWLLQPHCGRCGWLHDNRSHCPCCGEYRAPMPERRKKVMGLRPWLQLARLYGPAESSKMVEEYQQTRGKD